MLVYVVKGILRLHEARSWERMRIPFPSDLSDSETVGDAAQSWVSTLNEFYDVSPAFHKIGRVKIEHVTTVEECGRDVLPEIGG